MRYSAAILAVALAPLISVDGFSTLAWQTKSSFTPKTVAFSRPKQRKNYGESTSLKMLVVSTGGMMELEELTEKDSDVTKKIRSNPKIWKIAGLAAIPASAALGFGLVPSRRLVAHAVGAMATAIAGAVGQNKMLDMADRAVPSQVASVLIENGINNPKDTAEKVKAVQELYGVNAEDLTTVCTDIYKTYFTGMFKFSTDMSTAEIAELGNLKESLMLDDVSVGEAIYVASEEWFQRACLFKSEEDLLDADSEEYMIMNKILYLADRGLCMNGELRDSQGYRFEMRRLLKLFGLAPNELTYRLDEVIDPFYSKALTSAREKLGTGQVSKEMLERARQTLGVSDFTAEELHTIAFKSEVRELLGLSERTKEEELAGMKFPPGSEKRLRELMDLFGMESSALRREINFAALPLFRASTMTIMKGVIEKSIMPDAAWDSMDARRAELLVAEEDSKDFVSSLVTQSLSTPLKEANKFARVDNIAATYDRLVDVIESKKAVKLVLARAGWTDQDDFDSEFCSGYDKSSVCGFLSHDARQNMFSIYLARITEKSCEEGSVSDDTYDKLREVQGLLAIGEDVFETNYNLRLGRKLSEVLEEATEAMLDYYSTDVLEEWKEKVRDVIARFRLSESMVYAAAPNYYTRAIENIAEESPGGVPTVEQVTALDGIREFLRMTVYDVYEFHMETFGPRFRKAVGEAMSVTGVVSKEYKKPLEELRERLGLPSSFSDELFLGAVEDRMRPMLEWVVSGVESSYLSKQQLAQRSGKDLGQDYFSSGREADGVLGLGSESNVMGDVMNLIDFYLDNDIIRQEQVGEETIQKTVVGEDGEEVIVTEDIPVYETVYPLTALGMGAMDDKMAELLYRQFVVGGFTAQGPEAGRYEKERSTLAGILGLSSAAVLNIDENIGSTIYENYVKNAMESKGALDQQDMMFLTTMQGKLGLTSEQGEKMLREAQVKVLSAEISELMESPRAYELKAFREKCMSMGLSLDTDLGVSKQRRKIMFETEVASGLQSFQMSLQSGEDVREIQEALELEEEEAEEIFEEILLKLADLEFKRVRSFIRLNDYRAVVPPMRMLVRFAGFVDGDLGLEVKSSDAHKIMDVFDNMEFKDDDDEKIQSNKRALTRAVGLA